MLIEVEEVLSQCCHPCFGWKMVKGTAVCKSARGWSKSPTHELSAWWNETHLQNCGLNRVLPTNGVGARSAHTVLRVTIAGLGLFGSE